MPIPAAVIGAAKIIAFVASVAFAGARLLGMTSDNTRNPADPRDPGLKTNTRSTQELIKVLYGQLKIGGNDVYMAAGGTDNKELWIVQALGEGECDSIAQVESVDQVWLGDKLVSEFGSNASYWFHGGTSGQSVDSNLAAAFPEWTDPLPYTCYMVYKLVFHRDLFQSLPQRTVLLKGRKLYDFRDASTAWSDNPVLCLYDYLTNTRYGMGISASAIDTTSWTAAANYCDTQGWTLNMRLMADTSAVNIIDDMCRHFRGTLVWWDGKYYLRYADLNYESSVMTLTDAHIARDPKGKARISMSAPSSFGRNDGLRVKFVDPDNDYATDDVVVGDTVGTIGELSLMGCTDREMACNLAAYYLEMEQGQIPRIISGVFRDDALQLEPHDIVTFTSQALALENETMRVLDAHVEADGLISLTLRGEALTLYDDDYNVGDTDIYNCTLPDPTGPPPSVQNVAVSEETYDYRLRTFTRLNVSFDAPADYPWFDFCEIWVSHDNSTWEHQFNTTTDFCIDNVEDGEDYYIRIRAVSIHGVKQDTDDAYVTHWLVGGRSNAPTSLSALYAVVNANCVNLYGDKVSDPDVELYEFRLGTAWAGSILLGALRSPNLSLYGVKPGSHTFWANTLGANGIYGETPRSATVSLLAPPDGWTVQNTETCDYVVTLEDFTGYTEVDPDGTVTVAADTITFTDFDRNATAYVYKDFGAGYFSGDFVHQMKLIVSDFDYTSRAAVHMLANTVDELFGIQMGSGDAIGVYVDGPNDTKYDLVLFEIDGGTLYTSTYENLGKLVDFHLVIERDESVGSYGRVTCHVYADETHTWLLETLTLDLHSSKKDFRYLYGLCAYDTGSSAELSGTVEDLLLDTDGVHQNTEHVTYASDDYLTCSHGVTDYWDLTGTFTSEVYDLGASGRYLVYLVADIVMTGAGTTWNDVVPSPQTWEMLQVSTRNWTDIFQLDNGSIVAITLKYKANIGDAWSEVNKMEILSGIVTGRYFQVEITITDPSESVNALVENFELKFCQ